MRVLPAARFLGVIIALTCVLAIVPTVPAQKKMDRIEKDRMKSMLKNIKNAVKKDYYDPNFHGIDIEERFATAEKRLGEVETVGQSFGAIAQVLMDFNDSHLYFLPPPTNVDIEYGWRANMFGDKCLVRLVKPNSDAEAKGLKVGDQILSIEGFRPTRKEWWKVMYFYNQFGKRARLRLSVLSPGADSPRDIEIDSKIKQRPKVINRNLLYQLFDTTGKDEYDYNYFKNIGNIAIWKMPTFGIDPASIDVFVSKVKDSKSLILDLRGNGGGLVATLERLAGYMFDKDLTIAELKGRKQMDPQKSKTRGKEAYAGNLIVLVDGNSGSAAEIFARLVQLEKRGKVLGDVSSGSVMQSRQEIMSTGANDEVVYGASVTNADVIMSDGKSLEHVGVVPDETIVPSGADLANQKDPVLARAIELLGGIVSADDAGKFFRYVWREDDRIEIDVK
ncbi:MAG: S41 family peptidase [Pyrinomonadaceae bacterium]